MSADEVLVTLGSGVFGFVLWTAYAVDACRVRRLGAPTLGRDLLLAVPLVAMGAVFAVLRLAAASDVRDDETYLTMYSLLGALWISGSWMAARRLGIDAHDDVFERGNVSAAIAIGGAMLGVAFGYAGGNVGDGPGWWVVVFSSGLATVALLAGWWMLHAATPVTDAVVVDRDLASGFRLAGFLVSMGMVAGRAAAGNWVSAPATVVDFVVVAWPLAGLIIVATLVERVFVPTPANPRPSVATGSIGVLYVAAAVAYVRVLGLP